MKLSHEIRYSLSRLVSFVGGYTTKVDKEDVKKIVGLAANLEYEIDELNKEIEDLEEELKLYRTG